MVSPLTSFVALYTVLVFSLWTVYVATVYPAVAGASVVQHVIINEMVRAGVFVLPAIALLRAAGSGTVARELRLAPRVWWGVGWGSVAGALLLLAHVIALHATRGELRPNAVPLQALATSLSLATVVEEIAFRGYVLGQLMRRWPFPWPDVTAAALLAAIHIPGWLLVGGPRLGAPMLVTLSEMFALGVALALLFRWTRSLWSCVLLHAAHNLAAMLFYAPG